MFDASAIADGDIVTVATMDFVILTGTIHDDFTDSISMVTSAPASSTAVVTGDYDSFGTTKQATDLTVASLTADDATFNIFTLNSTGRGNISLTGVTSFGMRPTHDNDNVEPTWVSGNPRTSIRTASAEETLSGDRRPRLVITHFAITAAITGTIGDGATEQEVRDGAGTIIITMTDDTWVAAGGTFDAQRQAIINGLDAAESETNGWNAQVRDQLGVSSVVRTSSTVVTITVSASDVGNYRVNSNETITATVPNAALVTSTANITATPTVTITASAESIAVTGTLGGSGGTPAEIVAGAETIILTLTNTVWVTSGATFDAQRQTIIDNLDSNLSDQNGWDARRADFAVGDVVRTSNTVVTITLSAASAYAIPETETITATAPAAALVYGGALVGSPTFNIVASFQASGNRVTTAIDLSAVTDVAYCSLAWEGTTPANTTLTVDTTINGGATYTTGHTNGNCPSGISVGASLASITDFRIRVNLATTDSTVQPTVETLALIIEDDSGQDLYYQLNTTPGVSLTDRSSQSHAGTMSFPVAPTGITSSTEAMRPTREQLTTQQALTDPSVASAVPGSATADNLFNQTETGWTGLPFQGVVTAMSTAGDGLPIRFVWFIFLGLLIIGMGFAALTFTQNLFIAALTMGAGIGLTTAMGAGLMPGWVLFAFAPIAAALVLMRRGLPI